MISSLMFINHKGEILIYRVYRDDITRSECVQFCSSVVATKENKESPIIYINGTSYIHIQHKDMIILAATKSNVNVAMVLQFLYSIIMICKSYFRGELDEKCIRENFVLIYELLDEICDYGIPQITDAELLKKYIQEGGMKTETMNDIQKLKQLTQQATGVTSWRPEGIKYKRNEVYIDIIENINTLFSNQSTVLRVEVQGLVRVKCQLSDMPECKFGMNDKLLMEKEQRNNKVDRGINISDLKFHQCVRLGKFDKDRSITFIPPDGNFDLMTQNFKPSYRITENINLPFKIIPIFNELPKNANGRSKIECIVKLKSIFDQNLFGQNVVVKIPCPKNTIQVQCQNSLGKAKYEPDQGGVVWRIRKFAGDTESLIRCDIEYTTGANDKIWVKPPIQLEFQIPMFTPSGLRVRFLRVYEKSGYKPIKWIRYLAKSGEYHHRL